MCLVSFEMTKLQTLRSHFTINCTSFVRAVTRIMNDFQDDILFGHTLALFTLTPSSRPLPFRGIEVSTNSKKKGTIFGGKIRTDFFLSFLYSLNRARWAARILFK